MEAPFPSAGCDHPPGWAEALALEDLTFMPNPQLQHIEEGSEGGSEDRSPLSARRPLPPPQPSVEEPRMRSPEVTARSQAAAQSGSPETPPPIVGEAASSAGTSPASTPKVSPANETRRLRARSQDSEGGKANSAKDNNRASTTQMTRQSQLFHSIVEQSELAASGRLGEARTYERSACDRFCIVSPDNPWRVLWDMAMMGFVLYVAISLPYFMAFEKKPPRGGLLVFEHIVDACFILDVVVHFRTGLKMKHGGILYDSRVIARQYVRSWFPLDFVSSIPMNWILTGAPDSFRALKAARIPRLAKAVKMLRIGKIAKLSYDSPLGSLIDDYIVSSNVINIAKVVAGCVLIAHFMACFMALSGDSFLDAYSLHLRRHCDEFDEADVNLRGLAKDCVTTAAEWIPSRRYLTAMYWATTTMTTVGYGDLTPQTDAERGVAIVAMLVGGGFYGYVIGIIATLVAVSDANSRAISEKLDIVDAWLDFNDFPPSLKRRVRAYFRSFLEERSALDEQAILNDLDPGLRSELDQYLTPQVIRDSLLFGDLAPQVVGKLVTMLRPVPASAGDTVQVRGAHGSVMHLIVAGTVALVYGLPKETPKEEKNAAIARALSTSSSAASSIVPKAALPPPPPPPEDDHGDDDGDEAASDYYMLEQGGVPHIELGPSDSFGELVALSVEEKYDASAIVMTPAALYLIERHALMEGFANMPEVLNLLRAQAMETQRYNRNELDGVLDDGITAVDSRKKANYKHLKSTLIGGGGATLPTGFADTVLSALGEIQAELERNAERSDRRDERDAALDHAKWLESTSADLVQTRDCDDWLAIFGHVAETWGLCCVVSDMMPADGSRTCPMVYVNSAFLECTEYPREEVLYRNCRFLQGDESEPEAIQTLRDSLARGADVTVMITNYRKSGEMFKNLLSMRAVYDADDNYRFVIGVQFEVRPDDVIAPKLQELDKLLKLLPRKLPFKSRKATLNRQRGPQTTMLRTEAQLGDAVKYGDAAQLAACYEADEDHGGNAARGKTSGTWLRGAANALRGLLSSVEGVETFGHFLEGEKLRGALDFYMEGQQLLDVVDAPRYRKVVEDVEREREATARRLLAEWSRRTKLGGPQALYIGATVDRSRNAERFWEKEVHATSSSSTPRNDEHDAPETDQPPGGGGAGAEKEAATTTLNPIKALRAELARVFEILAMEILPRFIAAQRVQQQDQANLKNNNNNNNHNHHHHHRRPPPNPSALRAARGANSRMRMGGDLSFTNRAAQNWETGSQASNSSAGRSASYANQVYQRGQRLAQLSPNRILHWADDT